MPGWLSEWLRARRRAGADARRGQPRWVVIDIETTGLDPARDEVLAIGAVALADGRLPLADSFEIAVRPSRTSAPYNILVHGIGASAQLAGADPAEAVRHVRDYVADDPLVAYHAAFDRAFLDRMVERAGGAALRNPWIDLAALAPAIAPGIRARTLDEWLDASGITVAQRHHAVGDAWGTAMLFARLLADVPPAERTLRELTRRIAQARWLNPRS